MYFVEQVRKFLMNWVLAPYAIRVVCFLMSRVIRSRSKIFEYQKKSNRRLYVLANGPSLKKDLVVFEKDISAADTIVVNFMGLTPEFFKVRPTCYVFADPVFFTDPLSLSEEMRKKVEALRLVLSEQIEWSMTIVTLGERSNTNFIETLKKNVHLKILSAFNGVLVPPEIKDFEGWALNRYSPPAQNVINFSLYLGIVWRYPEIVLLGADTSFHTMVHVEQDTNRLYIDDAHFYGTERRYMYQDPEERIPNTMSNFLFHVRNAFLWYEKLREFADWAGVRIINASSFSWIDAFDRPKMVEGWCLDNKLNPK